MEHLRDLLRRQLFATLEEHGRPLLRGKLLDRLPEPAHPAFLYHGVGWIDEGRPDLLHGRGRPGPFVLRAPADQLSPPLPLPRLVEAAIDQDPVEPGRELR